MPYIGRGPSKSGAFRILDDISGSFNGSTTSFALTVGSAALTVGLPETLLIAVDGVIQEPGTGFTISGSNIVFGSAPQDSATFWGVELGDVGGLAERATTQSASNDSTKIATTAYVDNQIDVQLTAEDLDVTGDSGTIAIDLDSEALAITGGTGITTTASGNAVNIVGHAEAHTVASHSDTTATGAELETLTDGSTTALHVHAIADDSIVEAKLDVSNAPTNGQFLQAQSGEGGGLTWAVAATSMASLLDGYIDDGSISNLVVLRNSATHWSTLTSTGMVQGTSDGPWEFYDGDQATASPNTSSGMIGGVKLYYPSANNQRAHLRWPTGFGNYGGTHSVRTNEDWTIMARVKFTGGNAQTDFMLGMCLHTDTADSTYNAANRSYKHRIGIAVDGVDDDWHVFVDNDSSETVQSTTSNSPDDGAIYRLKLKISGNGTVVQGFVNGTQIGSNITTNIPALADGMLICGIMGAANTNTASTVEVSDLIAYREV